MRQPGPRLADWLAYIETVHGRSVDMSLDRVHRVLGRLDDAAPDYLLVSVAGTNGKGSSVGLLEAILTEAGYRVGAYTSPHLIRYAERVRIARVPVPDAALCRAFETIETARGDIPLTYFEFGTLAALLLFRAADLDVAVMEVGMGGRLDAVNAVDPVVSVITNVGIDHVDWLGSERSQIALEKAGVMRPARPVVLGDENPPQELLARARALGSGLYRIGHEFNYRTYRDAWDWHGPQSRQRRRLPFPSLVGAWQLRNAAAVLMVLDCLKERIPLEDSAVHRGLHSVRVPGRFQIVPGDPKIILDVAHNLDAVRAMHGQLRKCGVKGRTYAVCAMLRDKPVREIAKILAHDVDGWFVAPIDVRRGASAEYMRNEILLGLGGASKSAITVHASVVEAFDCARAQAAAGERILVFGSFYTVGDIMTHLQLSPF